MAQVVPMATYRLQLTAAFGFREAAAIVPYLHRLGITHVYTSPILQSRRGSTHGYDMVDPTRIDEDLGGDEGLARLIEALRAEGLGLAPIASLSGPRASSQTPSLGEWRELVRGQPFWPSDSTSPSTNTNPHIE